MGLLAKNERLIGLVDLLVSLAVLGRVRPLGDLAPTGV